MPYQKGGLNLGRLSAVPEQRQLPSAEIRIMRAGILKRGSLIPLASARRAKGESRGSPLSIGVPLLPAVAAVHLQQLALPDQVANAHRLEAERLRLASARLVNLLSETAIAPSGWP
jgi:hypothetical protein